MTDAPRVIVLKRRREYSDMEETRATKLARQMDGDIVTSSRVSFLSATIGPPLWMRSAYDHSNVVSQHVHARFDMFGLKSGWRPYMSFGVQRVRPDARAGPRLVDCTLMIEKNAIVTETFRDGSLDALTPADTAVLVNVILEVLGDIPPLYAEYVTALKRTATLTRLLTSTMAAVEDDTMFLSTTPPIVAAEDD